MLLFKWKFAWNYTYSSLKTISGQSAAAKTDFYIESNEVA